MISLTTFDQPTLQTERLRLEPVIEAHTEELWHLFRDPDLHHFVPFEVPTLEEQRERCARWARRRSPDDKETWLNWAGRDRATGQVVAHFQAGIEEPGVASIGYLVARAFQKRGLASEGLEAVFACLQERFGVRTVKAWTDTRNVASHRLAEKLGMVRMETIKDADFFKGASSDEFVYAKELG